MLNARALDVSASSHVNTLTMVLALADKTYTLLPNSVMGLTGLQMLRNFRFSDDYLGYNIMVMILFYNETFHKARHMTPEVALKKNTNLLDNIRLEQTPLLVDVIKRIIWNTAVRAIYDRNA